jgi:hypothetical protein
MARREWIEHRLLNWARWKLRDGGGALGYASVNLASPTAGIREPYAEVPIPISDIEASCTDDAVNKLPGECKATVIEVYTGPGGEADHMRRLCCGKSTMHARIDRAHRLLADHFTAQQDRQRAERARVEQLTDAIRPPDVDISRMRRRRGGKAVQGSSTE